MAGGRRLLGCTVEQDRALVDRRHQLAQGFHGVIDGVRDSAGDVLVDRGLHGEIAVSQAAQFIQQPQNRLLIALGLLGLRVKHTLDARSAQIQPCHDRKQQHCEPEQSGKKRP